MSMEQSTLDVEKLKTNAKCLPSFWVPTNIASGVVKNVSQKHSIIVIFRLFSTQKKKDLKVDSSIEIDVLV